MGIQPDIIVCRSEHELDQSLKDKIALFCNVPNSMCCRTLMWNTYMRHHLQWKKRILQKLLVKLYI